MTLPQNLINQCFLDTISNDSKNFILDTIAYHNGISRAEALAEVTADGAEHILDYMVEPQRGGALVLMQRHGFSVADYSPPPRLG